MGARRKIRLGDCPSCAELILVDVSGDDPTPVTDRCHNCGTDLAADPDRAAGD